jgi:hypothetical protein
MARESEVGHHTLDRIYGAMVDAATDGGDGVEVVREAESAIQGPAETCPTCRIAFIVPATVAAARAADLERAQRYARDCERALEVVALPPAWHAAVDEAQGWLARADGRPADASSACRPGRKRTRERETLGRRHERKRVAAGFPIRTAHRMNGSRAAAPY